MTINFHVYSVGVLVNFQILLTITRISTTKLWRIEKKSDQIKSYLTVIF